MSPLALQLGTATIGRMNGGVAQRVRIVGACVVLAACSANLSVDIADDDTSMSGASGDAGESGTGGATSGTGGATSGTGTGGKTSGTGGQEDGPGGSQATGGSTTGEAGSDSGGMGGTGGTMSPTCATDCQADGQICDVDTLTCICPPETPDHCPGDDVQCTNVMSNDDDHCGDCATKCPTTSACNDGVCSAAPEVLYTPQAGSYISSNVVLSGDTLYWGERYSVLLSMAVTGGPVTKVSTSGTNLGGTRALAVDSTNLYAYDRNVDFSPPSLYRIPLNGASTARIVHEGGIGQSARPIGDFAVKDGVVYYIVGNQVKSVPADATDSSEAEVTGTVVATAADSRSPYDIAVDGSLLFWSTWQQQPTPTYEVEVDLISGGNRRTLGASAQSRYYGLTTDGTYVYWANGATLQRRVYDASTAPETIASTQGTQIWSFAINATTAYCVLSDGRLKKATFGGPPGAIARNQGGPLVIGDSGVYWATQGAIMRADL